MCVVLRLVKFEIWNMLLPCQSLWLTFFNIFSLQSFCNNTEILQIEKNEDLSDKLMFQKPLTKNQVIYNLFWFSNGIKWR